MTEQLTGREHIAPIGHAVALGLRRLVAIRDTFTRNNVERFPFGELLVEACLDLRAVVVLPSRRPVAAHPPILAAFTGLENLLDAPLVDDGVELRAHLAILRLPLDLVAVDDLSTVGIGAGARSAGDRAGRLIARLLYDLKGADAALGTVPASGVRSDPDAGATGGQPPVRGQGNEAEAVGATDGVGMEVGHIHEVRQPRLKEQVLQELLDSLAPVLCQCFELVGKLLRELCRPYRRSLRNQRCDRIELIPECNES